MKLDQERELSIRYHSDTDTLVLRNGVPAGNGETVARNLVAYLNDEDEVTGFVLEHAAELLRPYLFPELQGLPSSKADRDWKLDESEVEEGIELAEAGLAEDAAEWPPC